MTIGQCVCCLPAPQPVLLLRSRSAPAMLVTSGYYNSTYSYTQLHVHVHSICSACAAPMPDARCPMPEVRLSQLFTTGLSEFDLTISWCWFVSCATPTACSSSTRNRRLSARHAEIFTVSCVSFHSQKKALTGSHQGQLIIRVTIHKLLHINPSPLQMYHIYYTIYLILTVYMHIKSLADWRWDSIRGYAKIAPHVGALYIG